MISAIAELPFRITAILFGLRCNSTVIKSIVKLLNDHPGIKMWQVLPKHDGFGLRRIQVDRDEIAALAIREPAFLMFKDVVWDDNDLQGPEDLGPVAEIPESPHES